MANANPSSPGRKAKSNKNVPQLVANPAVGKVKQETRHGVKQNVQELANGDRIFTRTDLDPRFDRGRRGRKSAE
tara:strand:- start:7219 stop:7440 length:222 start_codon:yes stop_codon:yes gene_type:complete